MIACLGLGSNIGDRLENLRGALYRLNNVTENWVRKISPVYETIPVGGIQQPDYLNAAMEIETGLEAESLLNVCLSIEQEMGRIRRERLGPRIIDIDILLYGELILNTDQLTLPHPHMHERAFVLKPLADIAPDYVHPVLGQTVRGMLLQVGDPGIRKIMDGEL